MTALQTPAQKSSLDGYDAATQRLITRLEQTEGKAEIVGGRIVDMSPTGSLPHRAAWQISRSLGDHEDNVGGGYAYSTNAGFLVNLPNRKSFSPDAAWYTGDPNTMSFLPDAPVFAVEVRSEHDYGAKADGAILDKIADYFAAGTLVVWDVDLRSSHVVRKYSASDPANPVVFGRGDIADAEPAVPGWTFPIDRLF